MMLVKRHIVILALSLIHGACDSAGSGSRNHIEPVYDQKTGKLQLLKYDSNGNGKVDT
jgi:hypothetical protein